MTTIKKTIKAIDEVADIIPAIEAVCVNSTVRIPNDIADFFGVPEFLTREEFEKLFPSVAIPADGGSADWSAYADIFRAYEDHRVVVSVSANRLALVLSHYRDEQARIHCAQPVRQISVED